jgi:hypothetical protein
MSGMTRAPSVREGHARFGRLAACWMILRGKSVAYRVGFRGEAAMMTRKWLVLECEMDGKPVALDHVWLGKPKAQP